MKNVILNFMIFNLKQKIKKLEMLTLIDVCHRAAEAFS